MAATTADGIAENCRTATFDSKLVDPSDGFELFRKAASNSFHPLRIERGPNRAFYARCEAAALDAGLFSLSRYSF